MICYTCVKMTIYPHKYVESLMYSWEYFLMLNTFTKFGLNHSIMTTKWLSTFSKAICSTDKSMHVFKNTVSMHICIYMHFVYYTWYEVITFFFKDCNQIMNQL